MSEMSDVLSNKKILFVVNQLRVGGAAKMIKYVANLCADHFGKVTLLTYFDAYTPDDLNSSIERINLNVKVRIIPIWRLVALNRIKKVLKKEQYDIVCSFLPDISVMSRIATLGSKAVVVSAERSDPYQFSMLWRVLVGWAYEKSDFCFFQLEKARDFFGENVARHSFVIPNPYVPEVGVTPYNGKRKKTVVSAGRFAEQKRFDILVRAFALVHEIHPEYRLVLYGEGDCKSSYIELAEELGIGEYIDLPGYVNKTAAAMREHGIFVLSSDYEGIPNSLIEAMSVGLPVVATDCSPGGASFLTKKGYNGLLIPVHDVKAMAESINKLIEDSGLAKELSLRAMSIMKELDINVINNMWMNAFTQIIEKKKYVQTKS